MSITRKLLGCVLVACFSFSAFAAEDNAAQEANNAAQTQVQANAQQPQQVADASAVQNGQAQAQEQQPVNINTATAEQLETVKGLGKKRAQEIISYREKNGAFKSVDDLAKVKGIGKRFIEKHRSSLTVG